MISLFSLGYTIHLTDHVSARLKMIEGHFSKLNESVTRTKNWREAAGNLGTVAAGVGAAGAVMALALKEVIDPAAEVDFATRHLATALPETADKMRDLGEAQRFASEMSLKYNVAAKDVLQNLFLGVSYGLSFKDSMDNASVSLAVAKGGLGDAAEIGKALPILFNDFGNAAKAAAPQLQHMGDVVAYATRHFAFENVNQLMEGINASVGSARAAQMTFEDLVTTLSGFNKVGLQGAEAGTALLETLQAIGRGKFEKLGIEPATFKSGAVDVIGTLVKLGQKYQAHVITLKQFEEVAKALGARGTRALALNLKDLLAIGPEIHGNVTGAAEAGAAEILGAYSEQVGLLGKHVDKLRESLGVTLLAPLSSVAGMLGGVVDRVTALVELHPRATKLALAFTAVSAAILITTAGLLALTAGVIFGLAYWPALAGAVTLVGGALVSLLGWPIIVGGALVAAATLMYTHWNLVKKLWFGLGDLMYQAGVAMVTMLGEGIRAGVHLAVDAAKFVASTIADYFIGHSPPPVGPLHNLDRTRIVETIAESMRPTAVARASERAATALLAGAGRGAVSFTYAPVINAAGGATADIKQTLDEHGRAMFAEFRREMARQERLTY